MLPRNNRTNKSLDFLLIDRSTEHFSEDQAKRTDMLLNNNMGNAHVYQQLTSDLKALQTIQLRVDKLFRLRSSSSLQLEQCAKKKVYGWLGKTYASDSLESVFNDQVNITYSLKHSLGEAIKHSEGVLQHIENYTDNTVLSQLEENVQDTLVNNNELGLFNNQYEQSKAALDEFPLKDPDSIQAYRHHLAMERRLRKSRVALTRSMQNVVFRNAQRETLRGYEVMAHTVLGLMECLYDMVDASIENAINLREVYTLFREGAESMGALHQSFDALKRTMGLHSAEIGDYAEVIMQSATKNRQQPQQANGGGLRNYTSQVSAFARQTTQSLENEAYRIIRNPLQ